MAAQVALWKCRCTGVHRLGSVRARLSHVTAVFRLSGRSPGLPQPGTTSVFSIGLGRIFGHAYTVTALNLKGIVLFVAFVPQFLAAEMPFLPQVTILVATFETMAALNSALYGLLVSSARGVLRKPAV